MKKTEHYKQPVLSLSSATLPRILSSRMAAFPESQRDLLHCMHWPHHARGTFSHAPRIFHTGDALHDASQVRPLSCFFRSSRLPPPRSVFSTAAYLLYYCPWLIAFWVLIGFSLAIARRVFFN